MEEMTEEELEAQREAEAELRFRKLQSGELATYKGFDYELLDDGKFSIYDTEDYKNAYRGTYQLLGPCGFPLRECVEIPSTLNGKPVTSMRGYVFTNTFTDKIKNIIIPDSVTSIAPDWVYALANPKIKVTIDPNNPIYKFVDGQLSIIITDEVTNNFVTAKQENFIKYLEKLFELNIKVEIDKNNAKYKLVGGNLLTKDGKTLLAGFGKQPLFIISDGVSTIAINALLHYEFDALKELVIPASVRKIENHILSRSCKTIYFKGTKAEWENINIELPNVDLKEATVYFYSETPSGNSWHYAADGVTPEITHTGGTGFFSKILKKFGL